MSLGYIIHKIGSLKKKGFSWSEILTKSFGKAPKIPSMLKQRIVYRIVPLFSKTNTDEEPDNSIVLIEAGVLGDCVLILDAVKALEQHCAAKNIPLTIICAKEMKKIFSEYGNIERCEYACFESREKYSVREILSILKTVNKKKHGILIMRDSNPYAIRLSQHINAKEKIFYSYDLDTRPSKENRIMTRAFTETKKFGIDAFIPDIWKAILLRIGIKEYKTKIGILNVPQDSSLDLSMVPKEKYILICPEGSDIRKCIGISQLEKTVDYIEKKYSNYKLLFCIHGNVKNYSNRIRAFCSQKNIALLDDKTNLDQFIHLVKNAQLLISCDSGQVHLAAGLKVPCVSFNGYLDGPHFLPYKFDCLRKDDCVPSSVFTNKELECKYCGEGICIAWHSECRKRAAKNKSYFCLSTIEVQDVFDKIDEILGGKRV